MLSVDCDASVRSGGDVGLGPCLCIFAFCHYDLGEQVLKKPPRGGSCSRMCRSGGRWGAARQHEAGNGLSWACDHHGAEEL